MRRLLALPALVGGVLAGCGGDADGGGRNAPTATVQAGRELRVVGDEYLFDPRRVVVADAASANPTTVEITLDNRGSLAHNLKVFRGEEDLGGTPTFPGGRVESGTVELLPGEYRMVCTVGNHAELGMTGTLEVRAK